MYGKKLGLLLALPILLTSVLMAQQSSKSKSKSKLYEKDAENQQVRIRNTTAINSPSTDFSPSYYKNGIVFVSSRLGRGERDKRTGETYRELYFAPLDPNGEPASPESFSLEINGSRNEGPVTFSRDWKTMFFTRNNMVKGVQKADRNGIVQMKIYEANQGAIDWNNVQELPFNSVNYTCFHPSLSIDGKKLYFSSNMPGGYGGYDLYVSERLKTGWGPPRNLGDQINTDSNDVYPFVHPSGVLFFTSKGHNSLGGFDNFFVDLHDGGTEVVNMGEPFNTTFDDFGFITNNESTNGFFSSNRDGLGKDDIFQFSVENGVQGIRKPESRQVILQVVDAKTGKGLPSVEFWKFQPSDEGFISGKEELYNVELRPVKDKSNTITFDLVRKDASHLGSPDDLTNASGEKPIDLQEYRTYLFVVRKAGYKNAEKIFTLDPDNSGSETPVIKIALEESQAIPVHGAITNAQTGRELVNASIRFTHKTTGRQVNGSTNFKGEYDLYLPTNGDYLIEIEKEGFVSDKASLSIQQEKEPPLEFKLTPNAVKTNSISDPISDKPLEIGTVITIDKIYYDYNKATLNEKSTRYLVTIADLMKRYPDMEIDLISHTDARGDAKANLALSVERANNAKRYLKYLGIDESRIIAMGKGESEIRNQCSDGTQCSENEHAFNRRTEIKVRKISGNVEVRSN